MNSSNRSQNAQKAAAPLNNYEFDFGLGVGVSKSLSGASLKAQKQNPAPPQIPSWMPQPSSSSSGGGGGGGGGAGASWSHKPAASAAASPTPSWTPLSSATTQKPVSNYQLGGGGWNGPSKPMAGDITGKSWGSLDASKLGSVGLVGGLSKGAGADLFGDLLGGGLGRSAVSMKQASQPTFGMETMAASLPKGLSLKDSKAAKAATFDAPDLFANMGSSEMGDFVSASGTAEGEAFPSSADPFASVSNARDSAAAPKSSSPDVFGAFEGVTFGTNAASVQNSQDPFITKRKDGFSSGNEGGGDPFGDFQGGSSTAPAASSVSEDPFAASSSVNVDLFGDFTKASEIASQDPFDLAQKVGAAAKPSTGFGSSSVDPFGFSGINGKDPFSSLSSSSKSSMQANIGADPFEVLMRNSASLKTSAPLKSEDPLEKLWSSTKAPSGVSSQDSHMPDSWGLETDFGGEEGGMTTELEGLPPPPVGVTAEIAKDKGVENYKQGQFADAIKWLSWAQNIMESTGNDSMLIEVLTCRVSCLKEVGEYKKAVADCCKVLELDGNNTAMLLQRALLYESTEKYKLGVADMREVLKRDPQNRVASNTLSRLVKMADSG